MGSGEERKKPTAPERGGQWKGQITFVPRECCLRGKKKTHTSKTMSPRLKKEKNISLSACGHTGCLAMGGVKQGASVCRVEVIYQRHAL
jgi:hypothetical protein